MYGIECHLERRSSDVSARWHINNDSLPGDVDPETSHRADLRVLLVLQSVVLSQHLDWLARLDGTAQHPAERMELHPVLSTVHLSGVAHQRTLVGGGERERAIKEGYRERGKRVKGNRKG